MIVCYLLIQQTINTFNYRTFPKPYRCSTQSTKAIGLWWRYIAFGTEASPETFETETGKNGSRESLETETKSRESISGKQTEGCLCFDCTTLQPVRGTPRRDRQDLFTDCCLQ